MNPGFVHIKAIISLLVLSAILIGAQMISVWSAKETAQKSEVSGFAGGDDKTLSGNEDADKDGVPDWKETLLGLDPGKTDTDNDGISDGIEAENMMRAFDDGENGSGVSVLPFGLFPEVDKVIRGEESGGENTLGIAAETQKKVLIYRITPSEGRVGTRILIEGDGFAKKNTAYTGYSHIDNISSSDGKTITLAVSPNLPEGMEYWNAPIVYWFYVENENGLSNPKSFQLITR